jgi:hypothetical protein
MAERSRLNTRSWKLWAGVGGLVVAGVIVVGLCWDSEPKVAPDPAKGDSREIVRFLASRTLSEKPHQQKLDYLMKVVDSNMAAGARHKILSSLDTLSDSQIMQMRNNIVDAVRARYLNETQEYKQLRDPAEKRKYLDRKIADIDTYRDWFSEMEKNQKVRKAIPLLNEQGTFNMLMERTSPVERANLESYLSDAFQRYVQLKVKEKMAAGTAIFQKRN